jgi:hypothetical protein
MRELDKIRYDLPYLRCDRPKMYLLLKSVGVSRHATHHVQRTDQTAPLWAVSLNCPHIMSDESWADLNKDNLWNIYLLQLRTSGKFRKFVLTSGQCDSLITVLVKGFHASLQPCHQLRRSKAVIMASNFIHVVFSIITSEDVSNANQWVLLR